MENSTQRFVELLQRDAEMHRQAAETWVELETQNARLEDLDGRLVATAREMIEHYRRREEEIRDLIERVMKG